MEVARVDEVSPLCEDLDLHTVPYTIRQALGQQRLTFTQPSKPSQKCGNCSRCRAQTSRPPQISSWALNTAQMYADFVDAYSVTPTMSQSERFRKQTIAFVGHLQLMPISAPFLGLAIEALSLAHAGSVHNDSRLTHAASDRYGRLLTSLGQLMDPEQCPKPRWQPWEVLASIMLVTSSIGLGSKCLGISDGPFDGKHAMMHIWGAQQYLHASGPSALSLDHSYSRILVYSLYYSVIWLGMGWRKAIDLTQPQVQPTKEQLTRQGSKPWDCEHAQSRYQFFQPVPGLLEKTDNLLRGPSNHCIQKLQSHYLNIEYTRRNILFGSEEAFHQVQPASRILVSDTTAFDMQIEEHFVMAESTTFPSYFEFSCPDAAIEYTNILAPLLILDLTLLRMLHFQPSSRPSFANFRTLQDIEDDALRTTRWLCQTIYYYAKLESLAYAHWTTHILSLARNYFEEAGVLSELGWCQACLIAVQMRIKRLEPTRPPMLCSVRHLPPGLAAAGSYRAKNIVE